MVIVDDMGVIVDDMGDIVVMGTVGYWNMEVVADCSGC